MKRFHLYRLLWTLVPSCMGLLACGGGGGDSAGAGAPVGYVAASSASFAPTSAKDRATGAQAVAVHWVYAVNDSQPVRADLLGVSIGITFNPIEARLEAGSTQRIVTLQGAIAGSANGTAFTGGYSALVTEDMTVSAGKTAFNTLTSVIDVTLAGGGESATGKVTTNIGGFTPAYEWFLDRAALDQLPIGTVQTITSSGKADFNITVTDEVPIVKTNQPVAVNDRWTVLEKLPSMTVRGKTYTNVVKLSLQTRVPDLSGTLTTVTMYYWVAKGIGMIRGQGIYRVLNIDNVVYELVETNLTQV
jgi:hypothetical protein